MPAGVLRYAPFPPGFGVLLLNTVTACKTTDLDEAGNYHGILSFPSIAPTAPLTNK